MPAAVAPRPSAAALFLAFSQISLTSFGGGLSGWMFRDFVSRRAWLTEEEFVNALAISQALPGTNVSNIAIWIGYRLCGFPGALAGLAGILVPGATAMLLIAAAFGAFAQASLAHVVLVGAGAAAIGLPLSMGITTVRRVPRNVFALLLTVATFVAVAVLRWPILPVMLGFGAVGVALEYRRPAPDAFRPGARQRARQ